VAWFALIDSRIERREFGHGDLLAEVEHHFALIAAHHLLEALELDPAAGIEVDATLRAELTEGRHLHEHWRENMPVFNVKPRPAQPGHRSGRSFAERNPDRSPYWWLGFSHKTGAMLLPNVSAPKVHRLLRPGRVRDRQGQRRAGCERRLGREREAPGREAEGRPG
jgi:hypothetical protein